jgi:hypothetical protein
MVSGTLAPFVGEFDGTGGGFIMTGGGFIMTGVGFIMTGGGFIMTGVGFIMDAIPAISDAMDSRALVSSVSTDIDAFRRVLREIGLRGSCS